MPSPKNRKHRERCVEFMTKTQGKDRTIYAHRINKGTGNSWGKNTQVQTRQEVKLKAGTDDNFHIKTGKQQITKYGNKQKTQ